MGALLHDPGSYYCSAGVIFRGRVFTRSLSAGERADCGEAAVNFTHATGNEKVDGHTMSDADEAQ